MQRSAPNFYLLFVFAVLPALSCTAPGGPGSAASWGTDAGAAGDDAGTTAVLALCSPARASENLNARVDVLSVVGAGPVTVGPRMIQVSELFARFNTLCGTCHVAAGNGGRQISAATFAKNFDMTWLNSVTSDDVTKVMPPEGKPYSSRPDSDSVVQFVQLSESWLAQGRPEDMFLEDPSSMGGGGSSVGLANYAYSSMTNLGDCIPPASAFAQSPSTEMDSKDEFFAAATALPDNLSDTDLTTFDSATLAANGVIAYVPTYPLWSDGSGKLRHIRVPKGTSIKFDKETQSFSIPPNTRFYKTFFRKVVDAAGNVSNRKIETRLIVARPDGVDADGKTPLPTAIFGTYMWSADELTATLWKTAYRNNQGFVDQTLDYVTNELDYHDVIESLGPGAETSFQTRLKSELAKHPGLLQHYAVPGSLRCVQCHRGSPTHDFVLGFFPLQIAQRPATAGGTYEPAGDDEVSQLQRLIDYGVISGMTSPSDVVTLEDSQLPRKPRTPQELSAQAYMIGNCMHCHNPRGFPSLAKPELASALNFMPGPGTAGGGIFEMSLELMSPVRARGASQDVPIPYITPSLRDYPVATVDGQTRVDNGSYLGSSTGSSAITEMTWTPKYNPEKEASAPLGKDTCTPGIADALGRVYCGDRVSGRTFVAAPWRSLIYRNVDAPFPYFDDYVPFPHMPMNSAGFDCRAPRIMGDWMVSLPAIRKLSVSEDALPTSSGNVVYDNSAQPYLEVKPTSPLYPAALKAANDRLDEYHGGVRYKYCEDILSPDILDPLPTVGKYHPNPDSYLAGSIPPADPAHPERYVQPAIGVPFHSHWFNYDPTDSPPPWAPRRPQAVWKSVLEDHNPDDSVPAGEIRLSSPDDVTNPLLDNDIDSRKRVVAALEQAEFSEALRKYATTELPFGLWQTKPGCEEKLARPNIKKVGEILDRPVWMSKALAPDAPVFMMSPGGALYRHICFNCHGPQADGKGLQGDALAAASEGEARPANFVVGLFGPVDNQRDNLKQVFGGENKDLTIAEKLGSKYMAWMALGGTLQLIPNDVIHQVEATRILGQARPNVASALKVNTTASANMLNLAKGLCAIVLPDPFGFGLTAEPFNNGSAPAAGYPPIKSTKAPFVVSNGDWELWMNICSRFSPPVVRVYHFRPDTNSANTSVSWNAHLDALFYGDKYPAGAQLLDHNRVVQTITKVGGIDTAKNYYPACLMAPTDEELQDTKLQSALAAFNSATNNMPACPPEFLANSAAEMWTFAGDIDSKEIDKVKEWTLRGAIAAGMSVFSYLESADLAHMKAPPYYNECQLLP